MNSMHAVLAVGLLAAMNGGTAFAQAEPAAPRVEALPAAPVPASGAVATPTVTPPPVTPSTTTSSTALSNPSPATTSGTSTPAVSFAELQLKTSALAAVATTSTVNNDIPADAQQKLDNAYLLVKDICTKTLASLSGDAKERARYSVWIALTGALAGSVIAPGILSGGGSKVTAALFSGVSGVANTAQTVVAEQGLTAQSSRTSREKVVTAVRAALSEYGAAMKDTNADASTRLMRMKAALFLADMECFLRPE